LFAAFMEEALPELKGQFLERDYGHLLHHVASVTDQQAAATALKNEMKATDAELTALTPHLDAVYKEYGKMPLKAAQKLALISLRGNKTATGTTAARAAKTEGLNKLGKPIKGGSPTLATNKKYSQDDFDKLSPIQQTAVLNGLDPAKYAGM
jgi:hypothetical protein